MIKMIAFDLDGVLVDTRDIHYRALNLALAEEGPEFPIEREDHVANYDGLPTRAKLERLTAEKSLPADAHDRVWKRKQDFTREVLSTDLRPDPRIADILRRLRDDGHQIYVASNAVRDTVKTILLRKGFMEFVDHFLSNEDVRFPKPSPEVYLRCMLHAGVAPGETLVVEDSRVGRQAATASGGHLCAVREPDDITYEQIKSHIDAASEPRTQTGLSSKWSERNLNVLIPMAGAGSRFEKAGFAFPKPLIEVRGKPMIQLVVENLSIDAHYIFVVQKEHYQRYNLQYLLNLIAPDCSVVQVDGVTEGAACTTLTAREHIDNQRPLLIVNSDQYVEWDSSEFMYSLLADAVDGGIATFSSTHPKWSFARVNESGLVVEVAEKRPISDRATVGIYYWRRGSDYVRFADQMIANDVRTNGEFYICPVFNEAIAAGQSIKAVNVRKMWGLGTPEDLDTFLRAGVGTPPA